MTAKLAFASFGEDLASFIHIKRKCWSAVLGRAGLKLEPKGLIQPTCFCKGIFPEKEVERVHDFTQPNNVSLVNQWQMPTNASASSSTASASGQKRSFSGPQFLDQAGQSLAKRCLTTSSTVKSPATNEAFERRHKSQASYQRRADRPGDHKPASSGQFQSRGGKSFRGRSPKGNSSNSN